VKTLAEIKSELDRRAALIGASEPSLPTYGRTVDFGRPHIEVDSRAYHWVVVERGEEQTRFTTPKFDELLYRVFKSVTFDVACAHELAHRVESQDSRRLMFQRQVELLGRLSESWALREAQDHDRILREHPFDDLAVVRARLSTKIGWAKSCEQYPLPTTNEKRPNKAPEPTITAVTIRAPSSTARASRGRGSS
jgi:hypothetical protein